MASCSDSKSSLGIALRRRVLSNEDKVVVLHLSLKGALGLWRIVGQRWARCFRVSQRKFIAARLVLKTLQLIYGRAN